MYNRLFITGLFLFILFSCWQKKDADTYACIDIDNAIDSECYIVRNLSRYADSVWYIPLETTDASLIKYLENIYLENNILYVKDEGNRCLTFSAEDGRYLGDIGRKGQGPGEFTSILGVDIFPQADRIRILGNNSTVWEYRMNGEFIQTLKLDVFDLHFVTQIKTLKSLHAVCDLSSWKNNRYSFYVCDDSARINYVKCNYEPIVKTTESYNSRETALMTRYADEIHYLKQTGDTLFAVRKDTVRPLYILDYGKYKQPLKEAVFHARENKGRYVQLTRLQEFGRFLFMGFDFGKQALEPFDEVFYTRDGKQKIRNNTKTYGIYEKDSKQFYLLKQASKGELGLKNDIDGGPSFWPSYISSSGYMIMYYSAENFLEYQKKNGFVGKDIVGKIDFESNPIIIITKLKTKPT